MAHHADENEATLGPVIFQACSITPELPVTSNTASAGPFKMRWTASTRFSLRVLTVWVAPNSRALASL